MTEPIFRLAEPGEVGLMLDWAGEEGWNPGLEDGPAFVAADPEGFFLAICDARPVAAISVVNHAPGMAFLGLYLCRPAYRGRGIGYALWRHALLHAGGRCIGLDGVAAQEGNYAKSGFVRAGASIRLEGRLDPAGAPDLRAATAADWPGLLALDRDASGFDRPRFLAAWVAPARTRRTVVMGAGAVRGFAVVRQCRSGVKIGPVVAPDVEAGLGLMRAAAGVFPGDAVAVDLPSANRGLAARLADLGFVETFRTARMYRGQPPVPGPGLQAIATMELG